MSGTEAQLTPMMAQYRRIKGGLPKDALLLFRLGDFYEMFFEDAQIGSQLLNLSLTRRNGVPMCGLPHHAANGYISRLLKHGRKVAICDQAEEATPGKLVQREVTAILSPGTHFDERLLVAERNNFLAAAFRQGNRTGLAAIDLTTGDFRVTETADPRALAAELERLRPAELVLPAEDRTLREQCAGTSAQITGYDDWTFLPETAVFTLREQFKVASLDGFGLRDRPAAIGAAGAVVHYLIHHLRRDLRHLVRLGFYETTEHLILDLISLRNLEILEPLHRDAARNTTLFGALNRTQTPMGARRLRDWLTQPLAALEPIHRRQEAVAAWRAHPALLEAFRTRLPEIRDLERTLGRLSLGSGNGRDLAALRIALEHIPGLRGILFQLAGSPATVAQAPLESIDPASTTVIAITPPFVPPFVPLLDELTAELVELPDLVELLARAIADEPPLAVKEGGLIREGYNADLDELRAAARGGKDWVVRLQQDESARTGIPSLKIGFNSVFGYYIEVTKANLGKVPPEYIRKQTIANGERFITPDLKAMESRILGAEERAKQLEYDLFLKVREEVLGRLREIQKTASALARLDVLACFAEIARLHDWTQPEVADAGILSLRDGRHPVLDLIPAEERFVPNDTELDPVHQQIALITGPNMAGKSTFIRQVALLTLLGHTGCPVPAVRARIDLVDRIFTRIGASDDLARGQSTFMVEMSETANILNNATRKSLVILDEIGRGTSTFDGLSLAWSIVEHLHQQVGAKTLFATHYHELTELGIDPVDAGTKDPATVVPESVPETSPTPGPRLRRVRNYHVAVREWNDQLIFLRKVQPGPTDKSHGIQVARLAGVPQPVIDRAKEILRVLEEADLNVHQIAGSPAPASSRRGVRQGARRERLQELPPPPELDLFS